MNTKYLTLWLMVLSLIFFVQTSFSADVKITDLPEATSMASTDIFVIVTDPGTGSATTKRITMANAFVAWSVGNSKWVCTTAAGIPQDCASLTSEVDGHTDGTTLTAAQMLDPRCVVYNTGQGAGDVTLNLPTAQANLSCLFTVGTTVAANKWRVRAATNDKIYNMAADGTPTAGADNGYVGYSTTAKYPVVGNSFACWTFNTGASAWDWACKPIGNIVLTAE